MRILAGDIGGTKTLLQVIEVDDGVRRVVAEERFETQRYSVFELVLSEFLQERGGVVSSCFAVAGPVRQGRATLTNVAWEIDEKSIAERFAIPRVRVVNDFFAVARGVPILTDDEVVTLNPGVRDMTAPIAIAGAGTGLGEAFLIPWGNSWRVIASEGGHTDFGPIGPLQRELHAFLEEKYGKVSYERVVSGLGISDIYEFLTSRAGRPLSGVLPEEIALKAAKGEEIANETLQIFVDVYAAEAGNLALKVLARGGVYLAGGIAPKHLERFTSPAFLAAFCNKGRFSEMMRSFPLFLITESRVGLFGATEIARELAGAE